jgi:hypothetical protein
MKLELVPIEGQKILSEEDKERLKRKLRHPTREELDSFSPEDLRVIKGFLTHFIILSEQLHYEMADEKHLAELEDHIAKLYLERQALFEQAPEPVKRFNELMDLCGVEPWRVIEVIIAGLRGEDRRIYFETKNKAGIQAAVDNPFLMQVDDDATEQLLALAAKAKRLTQRELEDLIAHHSLESMIKELIIGRKVNYGVFWSDDYYDL